MNEHMATTGGSGDYFEPMTYELTDCFGALKNIQPDSVFSNRRGMVVHNLNNSSDEEDSTEKGSLSGDDQATAAVSETGGPKKNEKRKRNKSK